MRVVVSSANFFEAVSAASRVTPARPAMMAYSAVAISAKGESISVTGSDGELSVRCVVDGTVHEGGVTLVQPRPLAAWLGTLGDVALELVDNGDGDLVVSPTKGTPYRFRTVSATFPQTPKLTGTPRPVDLEDLHLAISAVRPAVDRDQRVVQLVSADGELRINATDTYRLSQATLRAGGFGDFTGLVPLSILEQVSADTDSVVVDAAGRVIELRGPKFTYSARLAAVAFPAVDSVLANLPEKRVTMEIAPLKKALARLAAVVDQEPLRVRVGKTTMELAVAGSPIGSGAEQVAVSGGPDVEFEFGVNLGYLNEALSGRSGSEVTLAYSTPVQPLFFVSSGEVPVTCAVMPVRL